MSGARCLDGADALMRGAMRVMRYIAQGAMHMDMAGGHGDGETRTHVAVPIGAGGTSKTNQPSRPHAPPAPSDSFSHRPPPPLSPQRRKPPSPPKPPPPPLHIPLNIVRQRRSLSLRPPLLTKSPMSPRRALL